MKPAATRREQKSARFPGGRWMPPNPKARGSRGSMGSPPPGDIKRNRAAGDRINSNCWEGDRFSSLAKIVGVSAWYASLASFRLEGRPFADIRCVKTRDRSEIAQERQPARFGYRLDVQDVGLG